MKARNVYMAIMRAAANGSGLRLTPDECFDLSRDDAISTVADNHLTDEQLSDPNFDWARVNIFDVNQRDLDY